MLSEIGIIKNQRITIQCTDDSDMEREHGLLGRFESKQADTLGRQNQSLVFKPQRSSTAWGGWELGPDYAPTRMRNQPEQSADMTSGLMQMSEIDMKEENEVVEDVRAGVNPP